MLFNVIWVELKLSIGISYYFIVKDLNVRVLN